MTIKKLFIRNIFNPLLWVIIRGSKRYSYFKKYKKKQWNSLDKNINEQKQKLFEMIKYCHNNVPYYQRIIKKNKIEYDKETIFEDIKKFPILTKDILQKEFNNLQSTKKQKGIYKNTSGGSTGEPAIFLLDQHYSDTSNAFKLIAQEWAHFQEGDCMVKLWGSERDILQGTKGIKGFIYPKLTNIYLLNSFKMGEKDMANFVKIINKKKPKMILAYVQSIYELAKFIQENKLKIHSPKSIMTSAGTLYPEFKNLIENVFKCQVYNGYGSREVGSIAYSCEKNEGLHLNIFDKHIEILNKKLKPVKSGEMGKIYITTLNNFSMPLIRYDIGDIAVPSKNKRCSCGRGLPLIESVKGRDVGIIKKKDGTLIDGEYFTHLFYMKSWIKEFQVVQKDYDTMHLNIVKRKEKNLKEIKEIEKNIKLVLGKNCFIKWNFTKKIEPTKSGKYLFVLTEVE